MAIGGKMLRWFLHAPCAVTVWGCAAAPSDFKVRVVDTQRPVRIGSAGLAEANNLLRLNNPGLALEAFRKLQRESPSADALAGIAACYAAMGRDDLAKANLEAALALAPSSPQLLGSIATVMDRVGLAREAADARLQAAAAVALTSAPAPAPPEPAPPVPLPQLAPAAAQTVTAKPAPVAVAEPEPVAIAVNKLETLGSHTTSHVRSEAEVARAVEEARRLVETHNLSNSVTVKLPPVRVAATAIQAAAPRLERVSEKEVALVTTAKPFWAPLHTSGERVAATQRRLPANLSAVPKVRLLNAARIPRLASLARATLMQRGWRKIQIGDHPTVRMTSIVLYPADKQKLGKSLARHFGIRARQADGRSVTVILGRDVRDRVHG